MVQDQLYFSPIFLSFLKSFNNSLRGKISVLDLVGDSAMWFFQAMELKLFHCPVIKCFVFCSPEVLSERIITRNKSAIGSGNLGDVRFNSLPIMQLIKDSVRTQFMSAPFFSESLRLSVLKVLDAIIQGEKETLSLINSERQLDDTCWKRKKEVIVAELFNTSCAHRIMCDIVLDTSAQRFTKNTLVDLLKLDRYGEIDD